MGTNGDAVPATPGPGGVVVPGVVVVGTAACVGVEGGDHLVGLGRRVEDLGPATVGVDHGQSLLVDPAPGDAAEQPDQLLVGGAGVDHQVAGDGAQQLVELAGARGVEVAQARRGGDPDGLLALDPAQVGGGVGAPCSALGAVLEVPGPGQGEDGRAVERLAAGLGVEPGLRVAAGRRERQAEPADRIADGLRAGEVELDVAVDGDRRGPAGPWPAGGSGRRAE